MMKVPNPNSVPVEAIASHLQPLYPNAVVKKPWIGRPFVMVPIDNYKMIVRTQPRRKRLIVDFTPPVLWSVLGMLGFAVILSVIFTIILQSTAITAPGGGMIVIGFLIVKAIFKSTKKEHMERFREDVERAVEPEAGSIF